jgi:hypothetical protein
VVPPCSRTRCGAEFRRARFPDHDPPPVFSSCYPLIAECLPVGGQILITSACGSARVADGSAVVVSPGNPVVVEYLTDDLPHGDAAFRAVLG